MKQKPEAAILSKADFPGTPGLLQTRREKDDMAKLLSNLDVPKVPTLLFNAHI